MRGPGCLDMKAGLAMAFHALAAAGDLAGVTLLVTGDEELGSRAESHDELLRVDAAVRRLRPWLPGTRIEVHDGIDRPPMGYGATAPLFELATALGGTVGLDALTGVAVGGGSDGNPTAAAAVFTLDGLGAVGDGLHAGHERVLVDELPRRTALVALLADRLLHGGPLA